MPGAPRPRAAMVFRPAAGLHNPTMAARICSFSHLKKLPRGFMPNYTLLEHCGREVFFLLRPQASVNIRLGAVLSSAHVA